MSRRAVVVQVGQQFTRLTVVQTDLRLKDRPGSLCECQCGARLVVKNTHLNTGKVQSCGCLKLDLVHENGKANKLDLSGVRFGRLVVHSSEKSVPGLGWIWNCTCDCGKEIQVAAHSLRSGNTSSCGCLRDELAAARLRTYHRARRIVLTGSPAIFLTTVNKLVRIYAKDAMIKTLKRDHFRCQLCEASGVRLHVHHIIPVSVAPELAAFPDNLVTLCVECHFYKAHGGVWNKVDVDVQHGLTQMVLNRMRDGN